MTLLASLLFNQVVRMLIHVIEADLGRAKCTECDAVVITINYNGSTLRHRSDRHAAAKFFSNGNKYTSAILLAIKMSFTVMSYS